MRNESLSLRATEEDYSDYVPRAKPVIGFWKIALAVFVGNILTGLLGAFIYSLR
jgi:purine-cytosine permease-like protein